MVSSYWIKLYGTFFALFQYKGTQVKSIKMFSFKSSHIFLNAPTIFFLTIILDFYNFIKNIGTEHIHIKQKSQMITLTFCVCPSANNFEKEELYDISVSRPDKTD